MTRRLMKTVIPFLWKKVKGCAGANKHEYAGRVVRLVECLLAPTLLWRFLLLVNESLWNWAAVTPQLKVKQVSCPLGLTRS